MADEKHKMQADGSGTRPSAPDETGEIASRRSGGSGQGGESGGGPYPNPHSGKGDGDSGSFKGGQSDQAYYGPEQLGDEDLDEQENAPSKQH